MANSFFIKDKITYHFRRNSTLYCFMIISFIVGVVVGLYFIFTDFKYTSLLTSSDKIIFDYITGTASYVDVFYSRFTNIVICLLIIFVFNISSYTSFLGYIFVGYQTSLFVMSCGAIISLYGLSGVLNVVLFVVPVNLINIIIMMISNVLCSRRALSQKEFKLKFFQSFKEDDFLLFYFTCVLCALGVCLINSFVLPLLIKSFVVINY